MVWWDSYYRQKKRKTCTPDSIIQNESQTCFHSLYPQGTRLNKIRWLYRNNEESFVNLAKISYTLAEVVMKLVFENYYEAFTSWTPNYNDSQRYETEISVERKFYFPPNVGCDMTEEIALVKKKIYDIVVKRAETVYDPDSFREFLTSTGATE